jgi:ribosomal protein S18 acetylase RimI-like enzyme
LHNQFKPGKDREIKSIYVVTNYRKLGIGNCLVKKALRWLDQKGAIEKIVEVAAGNEKAWEFYEKYGFFTSENHT